MKLKGLGLIFSLMLVFALAACGNNTADTNKNGMKNGATNGTTNGTTNGVTNGTTGNANGTNNKNNVTNDVQQGVNNLGNALEDSAKKTTEETEDLMGMNNDWTKLEEYNSITTNIATDVASAETVSDTDTERVLLLKDASGKDIYKTTYNKDKKTLKIVSLNGTKETEVFNKAIQ